MRLGFYADYTAETARFASEVGFDSLELSAWPGSSLDANVTTDAELEAIKGDLDAKGIQISALGYYPNYLDPEEGPACRDYLVRLMDLSARLGVGTIGTFAGRNPALSLAANLPLC